MKHEPGAKVKVFGREAEVVEHADGVVHVLLDGETVSVQPIQVEAIDLPSQEDLDVAAAEQ